MCVTALLQLPDSVAHCWVPKRRSWLGQLFEDSFDGFTTRIGKFDICPEPGGSYEIDGGDQEPAKSFFLDLRAPPSIFALRIRTSRFFNSYQMPHSASTPDITIDISITL